MSCEFLTSSETSESRTEYPEDICVLLVDSDPKCLNINSKMLHESGYRVMTAERALDALRIIRERNDDIDLIMTETRLLDMEKYELLETVKKICDLPIVFISAEENEKSMLGCLFKGASFYLLKPIIMDDLKNLWQFAVVKKRNLLRDSGCKPRDENSSDDDALSSPVPNEFRESIKRKDRENRDFDEVFKKQKLIWTPTRDLGINSYSNNVLEHMKVPGQAEDDILIYSQLQDHHSSMMEKNMFASFNGGSFQYPKNINDFSSMPFLDFSNFHNGAEFPNKKTQSNLDSAKFLRVVNCDDVADDISSDYQEFGSGNLKNHLKEVVFGNDEVLQEPEKQEQQGVLQDEHGVYGAGNCEMVELFGFSESSTY